MGGLGHISLRGVRVHNLKGIDLDIPHRKLIVLCGLSGSGKSSLALDTLYAEGQRRYIESFSAYTRQFLERLEKPDAERIDGLPPAIAVTSGNGGRSSRSTVGTATETSDYLRLLYAKIGQVFCQKCGHEVRRDSPQSAAEQLQRLPEGTRYMIAFPLTLPEGNGVAQLAAAMVEDGFIRWIQDGRLVNLTESGTVATELFSRELYVVIGSRRAPWPTSGSAIPWRRRSPRARGAVLPSWSSGMEEMVGARAASPPPSPLTTDEGVNTPSTAGHGGARGSARSWLAKTASWSMRNPSRGCTVSTVHWGPARNARDLETSSTSTWIWWSPIRRSRSKKGRLPRGTARRMPMNRKS
jgi:hypothetical protein